MRMDAGLDTGPMLRRESIPIAAAETAGTLHDRLATLGARLIVETLRLIEQDGVVEATPQPATGVTYAAKIDRAERRIDWTATATVLDRKVRAFSPAPGATAAWGGTAVRIVAATVPDSQSGDPAPGTVVRRHPRGHRRRVRRAYDAAADRRAARGRTRDDGGGVRRGSWRRGRRAVRALAVHDEQMQAARAVTQVMGGVRLRNALADVDDGTALRGRTLVQEIVYGTLRHWGTLDAIAGALVRKPIADPLLRSLVAVALYQLDHTRAPAFAVVDRAVFAAGELVRPGAKALVNALLRRYLRERTTIVEAVQADDVARWSYPRWWIDRVRRDYPADWQAILAAGNERPPLTLRVNRRVTNREALLRCSPTRGLTPIRSAKAR